MTFDEFCEWAGVTLEEREALAMHLAVYRALQTLKECL